MKVEDVRRPNTQEIFLDFIGNVITTNNLRLPAFLSGLEEEMREKGKTVSIEIFPQRKSFDRLIGTAVSIPIYCFTDVVLRGKKIVDDSLHLRQVLDFDKDPKYVAWITGNIHDEESWKYHLMTLISMKELKKLGSEIHLKKVNFKYRSGFSTRPRKNR